jgi:histidine decarboxylase
MWKKFFNKQPPNNNYRLGDYKGLMRYIDYLARHKLGYPVSLLTYFGVINNKVLGIKPQSLADVLLNNVGDPFKDSETSLLEVKKHEREILTIIENYFGIEKEGAKGYMTSGGTEGNFAALWWSRRYLINRDLHKLIASDDAIKLKLNLEQEALAQLAKIPINEYTSRMTQLELLVTLKDEIAVHKEVIQQLVVPTIFYSKESTHYSIPKIAEILRFNMKPVGSNEDGSVNLDDLYKEVLIHVGAHKDSPIIIIANVGTTITGAIDDVPAIKKMLDSIRSDLNYTIHMDGALMGFVLPILKPFGDMKNYLTDIGANTLAFSAHKYPGLSQPCGIVLASKPFFEKAFEKSERIIEYVGNILDYTITGSRSGLNILMLYNALCALGLDKDKKILKTMVDGNIATAKYLYHKLADIYGQSRLFYAGYFNVCFPRPSMALAKKYQLMLKGETATICVLSNVSFKLVDEFILDLKLDREMAMNQIKTEYAYVTLKSEHEVAATDIFIKSFCYSEPMTKFLDMQYSEYEPFATEVVQKAIREGLGKVALDKNNNVIAVAIAEDLANPFKPNFNRYPKLKSIFAFLDTLSEPFMRGKAFIPGKVLHMWIAAVDEKYRGQGLSTEIDLTCVRSAGEQGFQFVYTEFTNDISAKVTKQFKVLNLCNRMKFSDFRVGGHTPFKGLPGEASSYVATIRPGLTLEALSNCYKAEVGHPTS